MDGDTAVVLCLVGATHSETSGTSHRVWNGSHVRDTCIKTPAGWKRRRHEKLTVNERMIDGRPTTTS
ncbi:nuclear transport factor 2 family protein [Nevskia soli]|uniref:nuclear transport factor 2 family protein n=1 Tax=Nevskia soli TaxID=418856 RepID=UPI0034606304